ncbi:hypothetical protein HYR54_09960 [Candidatus Acetothermia bacterium]|nr:hypothetical protein [Candidatus Acetothermia bacterium]
MKSLIKNPYIDLFETLRQFVDSLPLDAFVEEVHQLGSAPQFEFWSAVVGTPLAATWDHLHHCKEVVLNETLPRSLREKAYSDIKYTIDETLSSLRGGAVALPRRRLDEAVINQIADEKVRKICVEINSTPDGNTISLSQLAGEALRWVLWYKAKQLGMKLREGDSLQKLLDEAIEKPFFTSNAANRFLKDFRDNILKTSFDMVRHSDSYIPTLEILNPQFEALEVILDECF